MTGKVAGHAAFVGCALAFFGFALLHQSDADATVASVARIEDPAADARPVTAAANARIENSYVAVLDPGYSLGAAPAGFTRSTPRGPRLQVASLTPEPLRVAPEAPAPQQQAEAQHPDAAPPLPPTRPEEAAANADIPLPMPRPPQAQIAAATPAAGPSPAEVAQPNQDVALSNPAPENDSIFQKLFGSFKSGSLLAFAAPDGGVMSDGSSMTPGKYDRYTAVYDISAKTLYLPNGRKLEAHSGLGNRLDDVRFVHERMRGPTPPHLYDLTWREKPFHGVRAIRLNPVGGADAIYGRTGLLVHTYLLGPNGDSNGCVSLKDYEAFMRAFESGQIKRLAVVAKL